MLAESSLPANMMESAWGQHSTTKRRRHGSHQMSSRHLSFDMVAEFMTTTGQQHQFSIRPRQLDNIIRVRISAGQLGNDISLQRPGGPQGDHRGGTTGNDISSAQESDSSWATTSDSESGSVVLTQDQLGNDIRFHSPEVPREASLGQRQQQFRGNATTNSYDNNDEKRTFCQQIRNNNMDNNDRNNQT